MDTIKEMRALMDQLTIQQAKIGCTLLGKQFSGPVSDWIDAGVHICTECKDIIERNLPAVENADKVLEDLTKLNPALLTGAIDMDVVRKNAQVLQDLVHASLNSWVLVSRALTALSECEEMKPIVYTPAEDKGTLPEPAPVIEPEQPEEPKEPIQPTIPTSPVPPVEMPKSPTPPAAPKPVWKSTDKPMKPVHSKYAPKKYDKDSPALQKQSYTAEKPLDWLDPMVDAARYLIYDSGQIKDTVKDELVKPINGGHQCELVYFGNQKGIWNIHELVWCAFHPEDREAIRTEGNVFRINGSQFDNKLTNLTFKRSSVPFPFPATIKHPTKPEEEPKRELLVVREKPIPVALRQPDIEYRCIDWLPGIDPAHYSITKTGTVVDNRAGAKEIVPQDIGGQRCVKLRGKQGKVSAHPVASLLKRAFGITYSEEPTTCINAKAPTTDTKKPARGPWISKDALRARIEDVLPEMTLDSLFPEKKEEPASEPKKAVPAPMYLEAGFVAVDWIEGIPADKYMVSDKGYCVDRYSGQKLSVTKAGKINLSNSKPGVDAEYKQHPITASMLVWKAFHPDDRDKKIRAIRFIDGNSDNLALSNLEH